MSTVNIHRKSSSQGGHDRPSFAIKYKKKATAPQTDGQRRHHVHEKKKKKIEPSRHLTHALTAFEREGLGDDADGQAVLEHRDMDTKTGKNRALRTYLCTTEQTTCICLHGFVLNRKRRVSLQYASAV